MNPLCRPKGQGREPSTYGWRACVLSRSRQVVLGFVPEAEVGDYVLVHVGFATTRVDAAEAKRTYKILAQLGALDEELAGKVSGEFTPRSLMQSSRSTFERSRPSTNSRGNLRNSRPK